MSSPHFFTRRSSTARDCDQPRHPTARFCVSSSARVSSSALLQEWKSLWKKAQMMLFWCSPCSALLHPVITRNFKRERCWRELPPAGKQVQHIIFSNCWLNEMMYDGNRMAGDSKRHQHRGNRKKLSCYRLVLTLSLSGCFSELYAESGHRAPPNRAEESAGAQTSRDVDMITLHFGGRPSKIQSQFIAGVSQGEMTH